MSASTTGKVILVTGANTGIGLALCKQLVDPKYGCRVLLGSRSEDKGKTAVEAVRKEFPEAKIDLVVIDVSKDDSVKKAAKKVAELLGVEGVLYALVNNAGTGLSTGAPSKEVVNTNYYGTLRVTEAFAPLLKGKGRIVNVGSGAGPNYVRIQNAENHKADVALLTSWETTDQERHLYIEKKLKSWSEDSSQEKYLAYAMSKACVTSYTMSLARKIYEAKMDTRANCLTPGFILTAITASLGATKSPAEGTRSYLHCLFSDQVGNGFFYGSDAQRSPLTFMRNPGEPVYQPDDDKYQK